MTRRTERVSNLIRQEISELLRQQINDPRLNSFISVTKVSTSRDLRHAKVFVSTLGNEASKSEISQGFTAASGFLRRELARRLRLRHVPELSFHFDDSIDRGAEVLRLIKQVASNSSEDEDEH
ncbi:MAG TPA: 30S ribosome-binding factor RbfA [Dehalococcoidia bacterium]|nr:30S ribosome-binding factor RbfA [Dehalococcoidia bacterium]